MRLRTRIAVGIVAATAALGCGAASAGAGASRPGTGGAPAPDAQPPAQSTQLPPAAREGWWVRVNPSTEAPYVHLRFGADPKRLSAPITRARSDNEFDVPAAERGLEGMQIALLAMPPAAPASVCIFYRDQGVKLVEFKHEQSVHVDRQERAEQCRP